MQDVTCDVFYGGEVKLLQPRVGYRAAIDPFLLAHFVPFSEKILDVGCGVGTVSVLLKRKFPTSKVVGVEISSDFCEIFQENAKLNQLDMEVINESIDKMQLEEFDCVVTNPPFYDKNSGHVSPTRELANFETIPLKSWIISCLKQLKNGGTFVMIHLSSRLEEIMCILHNRAGDIKIVPIYTKQDIPAKRVVIIAKKGSRTEACILPAVVVHNADGTYTDLMERILAC